MTGWTTTRTSADYTPAVAVWPSGKTQPCTVLAVRLDSVESARRKLAAGVVAWVRREDVERVREGAASGAQVDAV